MLTSGCRIGQRTSTSADIKWDINCTIYSWLVTQCSYPPLVLTQEKWGDVAVIFDQIANWFPRTGPSQVRESWPLATAFFVPGSTVGSSTSLSLWFLWDRWGACAYVVWRKTKRQHISRPSFSTVVASGCCSYCTWTMVTARFRKNNEFGRFIFDAWLSTDMLYQTALY